MDAMTVLRGIATLLVNPALGGGGIGAARGATLLLQLANLVEGGIETHRELDAFAKDIQTLVDNGGNPTRGQWEAMAARDAAARAALEANRKALEDESGGGEPAPSGDGLPQGSPATGGGPALPGDPVVLATDQPTT